MERKGEGKDESLRGGGIGEGGERENGRKGEGGEREKRCRKERGGEKGRKRERERREKEKERGKERVLDYLSIIFTNLQECIYISPRIDHKGLPLVRDEIGSLRKTLQIENLNFQPFIGRDDIL